MYRAKPAFALLVMAFLLLGIVWISGLQRVDSGCTITSAEEYPAPNGQIVAVVERTECDREVNYYRQHLDVVLKGQRDLLGRDQMVKLVEMTQWPLESVEVNWQNAENLIVQYRPDLRWSHEMWHFKSGPLDWQGIQIAYRDLNRDDPLPSGFFEPLVVPRPLALGRDGEIYVSDPESQHILRLSSNLEPVDSWETLYDNGSHYSADAIAISPEGYLYVVDTENLRLLRITHDGKILVEWPLEDTSIGDFRFFQRQTGIAITADGTIYVSDSWRHRVARLTQPNATDAKWEVVASGPGSRAMTFPRALALSANGTLYIAEPEHDRIRVLRQSGEEVALWANDEHHPSQVCAPEGLAIDDSDNLYVADAGNKRLLKLSTDGMVIAEWKTGPLVAVAVDQQGNVYTSTKGALYVEKRTSDGDLLASWGSLLMGQIPHSQ